MAEFTGTNPEFLILQSALKWLDTEGGIKAPTLMKGVADFTKNTNQPSYSIIDRLRSPPVDGIPHRTANLKFARDLWNYIKSEWPWLIKTPANVDLEHPFFSHMLGFYDAKGGKSSSRLQDADGRYRLYHFSGIYRSAPLGVVVSELTISVQGDLATVTEKQAYDGVAYGGQPKREENVGYCFFKHAGIVIVLHKADSEKGKSERTPKWYLFDHPHISSQQGIGEMTGHMCQLVPGSDLFTSPVYAMRAPDKGKLEKNVVPWTEIDKRVLRKLIVNTQEEFFSTRAAIQKALRD